jgi:hypothetical protein
MYEKMLQLLRSYRERSLTTQKFDRGRGKLIPKAASAKAVFTRRFRICRCNVYNLRILRRKVIENQTKNRRQIFDIISMFLD